MADDELDILYRLQPEDFTAKRTELAATAKRRGDAATAKRISAARKPTMAAWLVNRLVLTDANAGQRLADLGDRLRAAHASMDGEQIRDLSAEQHTLIRELSRAAIEQAGAKPSSGVRDDVSGTLQAAVADPEVRARLGRLAKAEQWSGFGDFGDAAPVSAGTRTGTKAKAKAEPTPQRAARRAKVAKKPSRDNEAEAAQRRLEKLKAAAADAERHHAEADGLVSERQAERDAARQRRDEAHASLRDAERELSGAQSRYDKAKRAGRVAAQSVKEAKAQLKRG
jgi:hypothetical protein